jgi:dUTP pyrophosphatase
LINLKIKRLSLEAVLPKYQTKGSVGFDLHSIVDEVIASGKTALIPTGLAFELPDNYEIQIRPRSGLALKNSVTVLNSPGTVDSDYRGEIKVLLINHGKNDFKIKKNDRIAQAVINKVEIGNFIEVENLEESERGEKGFGSTGI